MTIEWKTTETVISEFQEKNADKIVTTDDEEIREVDPQQIKAINETYEYPSILDDYKMGVLKKSFEEKGWTNQNPETLCLLEMPNGDLLVNGAGNHRAVLAKEKSVKTIKASVLKVKFVDTPNDTIETS